MDVNEALQRYAQNPRLFPLEERMVAGIEYLIFGDQAFPKDTPTSLQQCQKKGNEFYSLESLVEFLKWQNENHGVYVKKAAAANVRAISRMDRKAVTNYLRGEGAPSSSSFPSEVLGISLKHLIGDGGGSVDGGGPPEAKKPKMEGMEKKKKEEVEIRALNHDLTKDRIAEMRRKWQKNLEKGIIHIEESVNTWTSAQRQTARVHRTRENCMQGVRDLSNVLEIISAATRQWEANEKKEKVAAVHSGIGGGRGADQQQQRTGYSRYAQEAFAHEKTKEIQTEGSFIGSNLTALKHGHSTTTAQSSVYQQKPTLRSSFLSTVPQPSSTKTSSSSSTLTTSSSGKRVSRSPIIIVPSAMNTMINLYNVRDILQNFAFVSVEQRRKETNKKPTDLAIQRQRNGQTYNIRVIDQAEKLGKDDWDRVIGVFVMGVGWQFKGWAWGGSPTDIFTHIPAFHLYFDSSKPCAQVQQWNCHKIGISQTKRHMDKAKFQHIWDTIDNFVRKNKPHLAHRLGL